MDRVTTLESFSPTISENQNILNSSEKSTKKVWSLNVSSSEKTAKNSKESSNSVILFKEEFFKAKKTFSPSSTTSKPNSNKNQNKAMSSETDPFSSLNPSLTLILTEIKSLLLSLILLMSPLSFSQANLSYLYMPQVTHQEPF